MFGQLCGAMLVTGLCRSSSHWASGKGKGCGLDSGRWLVLVDVVTVRRMVKTSWMRQPSQASLEHISCTILTGRLSG